jgi:hypothetical protein
MSRYVIFATISLLAGVGTALAQAPAASQSRPPPGAAAPSGPAITMEAPSPGDHWTYERRDEILGTVRSKRTSTVVDVAPTQISTHVVYFGDATYVGEDTPDSAIFDRSWNLLGFGPWTYTPNDGLGVQLPLLVGKAWSVKADAVNSKNGAIWSRTTNSKVVERESVTTQAGTFDAFKIETSYSARNAKDPTRATQVTVRMWWAPSVDHWVKRTFTSRVSGHLLDDTTEVLVEYGRKQ